MKKILLLAILGLLAARGFAEKSTWAAARLWCSPSRQAGPAADPVVPPPGIPGRGVNVRYITRNGSNDAVLLTILTVPDDRFSDRESLRTLVGQATEQFIPGSVEGKADIKELRLGSANGFLRLLHGCQPGRQTERQG